VRSRSRAILRAFAATLIAALLLPASAYAEAGGSAPSRWQDHASAGFDGVILRPLGLIVLAFGTAFVVPVALFTWPNGRETIDEAIERFVRVPAHDVFERPLGDF